MREKREKIILKRLQVYNNEMKMTSVSKVKFASLNVEQYYFSDGIVLLPYGQSLLSEVRNTKKAFPKIHHVIEQGRNNLLRLENEAVARNEGL